MLELLQCKTDVWQKLKCATKPIVLYGMGDGALKIMSVCAENGIAVANIFASDEYVRGHSFEGYKVLTLSQVQQKYDDFIIVVAFAVHDEPMLNKLYSLSEQYELYAPDVPVAGGGLFNTEYVLQNEDKLATAYSLLADDLSRRVFLNSLEFKLSGKIEYLRACTTDRSEVFVNIILPTEQEHFVDLGAYDGDTIRELLSYTGRKFEAILALEPDKKNFKKLQKKLPLTLDSEQQGRVTALNLGAWSSDCTMTFASKAGRNSALQSGEGTPVSMTAADNVIGKGRATIIKLDVEGAEHEALLGCVKAIKRCKPRLMVSAYHRNEDLFDLPLLLHELCPEYKLYLRHHPYIPAWETNIYATL